VGNTLEALLAAYALCLIPDFRRTLDRLIDAFALLVVGGLVSTAISATIGVFSLRLGGIISSAQLMEAWRAWWLGDLIGDLLVAPVILVWSHAWQSPSANAGSKPARWEFQSSP
jgi:integral membrane sensor domain MASE1